MLNNYVTLKFNIHCYFLSFFPSSFFFGNGYATCKKHLLLKYYPMRLNGVKRITFSTTFWIRSLGVCANNRQNFNLNCLEKL